jgi:hypothetical protein
MKKTFIITLITFSLFNQIFAQNADNALLQAHRESQQNLSTNTSGSTTNFTPFYIIGDSLSPFEKVGAKLESKVIGMGYGGVNSYYTVFNSPHSPLCFNRDSIPDFVITVDPGTDVFEMVMIIKADAVKNKTYRRFVKGGQSMAGTKDMGAYQIIPELKLIGKDKYQIMLPSMTQGEYAFMPILKGSQGNSIRTASGNYRLYCFGIK